MANHLGALLQKNWIQWKRNCCCSCLEIFIPVLLCLFLFLFRSQISKTDIPELSYLPKTIKIEPYMDSSIYSQYTPLSAPITQTVPPRFITELIQNCKNYVDKTKSLSRNGHIAISYGDSTPSNPIITQLQEYFSVLQYETKLYTSKEAIDAYIRDPFYKYDICIGIAFKTMTNKVYDYGLMFNVSGMQGKRNQVPVTDFEETVFYKPEVIAYNLNSTIKSGFIQIQNWIDGLILKFESNSATFQKIVPYINSFKLAAHVQDNLSDTLKGNFAPYLVLPMIIIFLRMTYGMLIEKEKKIREGMKIMGMSNTSFYLSWIITYLLIYLVVSILVSLILKRSVFTYSNFGIIFIWHYLFCISLIFQSIFISVFFTRAKLGNIVAMIFYISQYMIVFFLQSGTVSYEQKRGASISSHAALSLSSDNFLLVESFQQGITSTTLRKTIDNFDVGTAIGMTIANILLFASLGLYLDQVFPNEFGRKQHPLFFIRWIWHRNQNIANFYRNEEAINSENFEGVEVQLKQQEKENQVLSLKNLSKIYPNGKAAVRDVSMTMYKSQIFVLLGHNGAGKTSTISMLTGMQQFSSGEAVAFGKNVETELEDIRHFMGVCPQHDILFDDLTVREHLEMYANFKGMNSKDIQNAVDKVIEDVDLAVKQHDYAKNLSGGQKRRLSVAIAFIGGSKLIYLDEPTSGMDTSARRSIWEMLKKYKNNKIVVLTTHFMDEADFLGDRIAIMGEGQLICLGSSVFLKNKFGVGYNLTLVKSDTTVDSNPIIKSVQDIIPQTTILSNVSAEVAFQLPMGTIQEFPRLFDFIDSNKGKLQIQSYGISITTLEEVFLRVANLKDDKPLAMQLSIKNAEQQKLDDEKEDQIDNFNLQEVKLKSLFFIHILALLRKRVICFMRDTRSFICEVFLPCIIVVCGLSILLINFVVDSPTLVLKSSLYPAVPENIAYLGGSSATQPYLDSLKSKLSDSFSVEKYAASTPQEWDAYIFSQSDKSPNKQCSWYVKKFDTATNTYEYYVEVQSNSKHSGPYCVNKMNQAITQVVTGQDVKITVSNAPMPNTESLKSIEGTADGIVAAFMFSIGFSFIPASLITFIVKEREDQVKHQHLVSGVSIPSYWISYFILDLVKHMVPTVFSILMVLAYNLEVFSSEDRTYGAICLLFFLYGYAIIPFSYLFGFMFKQYGNAQVVNFFMHFILGAVVTLIIFILRLIESTRDAGIITAWVLRIFPSFSFAEGIINIGNKSLYAIRNKKPIGFAYDTYDLDIAGGPILMLCLIGTFSFIMVFVVEHFQHSSSVNKLLSHENQIPYVAKKYDDDVQKEIENVESSGLGDYSIRVNKLRKVFLPSRNKINVAVDQVSFGIQNGECFALLGVNGAGKTTTFKILSGEINQTRGEAHIMGYSVDTQLNQARQFIGYCPQFDALLDNLTAKEHLELYGRIKGIPNSMLGGLVAKKLKEMDLVKYQNVQAGTYSGGNKRKLSVAIAMLGNPPIVFLDEPSTGMDPGARRFMWNVISRISTSRKNSSIILTTHSMEEAEALSTKMCIMVEGQMKCLGSTQHIKNKFGGGYEIEIKVEIPTYEYIEQVIQKNSFLQGDKIQGDQVPVVLNSFGVPQLMGEITEHGSGSSIFQQLTNHNFVSNHNLIEYILTETKGIKIEQFLKSQFGAFTVIEHFSSFYRFKIDTKVSIGTIFKQFEQNKQGLEISQYSVKQASIEQIFNMFATGKLGVEHQNGITEQQQIQFNQPPPEHVQNQVIKVNEKTNAKDLELQNME